MSVIYLYAQNPDDGTAVFDKTRFYEATDSAGTGATLLNTVTIDTTTADLLNPGYTHYNHTLGDTSKFYASTWYNTSTSTETDKSPWVQGGQDRWDTLFMAAMNDASSAVWTSADREWMKEQAIEALYPEFARTVIDTSLTVVNTSSTQTKIYTVPNNIYEIREVGIGNPNSITTTFKRVLNSNWVFERNQLRFYDLAGIENAQAIRLVGSKKFANAGEVPTRLDPLVLLHLRMSAYTRLADDFPRFEVWARLQQGTKVSFENLRVHAREFERKFNEEKRRLADNPGSSEII